MSFPDLEKGERRKALRSSRPRSEKELTMGKLKRVIDSSNPMYRDLLEDPT